MRKPAARSATFPGCGRKTAACPVFPSPRWTSPVSPSGAACCRAMTSSPPICVARIFRTPMRGYNVWLYGADLTDAKFNFVDLRQWQFQDGKDHIATLTRTDFRGAVLYLHTIQIDGDRFLDLGQAVLSGAVFADAPEQWPARDDRSGQGRHRLPPVAPSLADLSRLQPPQCRSQELRSLPIRSRRARSRRRGSSRRAAGADRPQRRQSQEREAQGRVLARFGEMAGELRPGGIRSDLLRAPHILRRNWHRQLHGVGLGHIPKAGCGRTRPASTSRHKGRSCRISAARPGMKPIGWRPGSPARI